MSIDLSKNITIKPHLQQNLDKKEEIEPFDPLTNFYKTKIKEERGDKKKNIGQNELSDKEKRLLRELKQIARRVKRHERAHKMAAGKYGGRIYYEYTEGPKGKRYPTEGHINLDTKEIKDDPEENIEKMQKIRKAALAPQKPSNKDRQIAMEARQKQMQSRMKLMRNQTQKMGKNYSQSEKDPNKITIFGETGQEISQSLDIKK